MIKNNDILKTEHGCVLFMKHNGIHQSWGSRARLVITSFLPSQSLQLIIAWPMGKFHIIHPILLLKEDSNCLVISETLHLEQDVNSRLLSDRPRPYHWATKQYDECIQYKQKISTFPNKHLQPNKFSKKLITVLVSFMNLLIEGRKSVAILHTSSTYALPQYNFMLLTTTYTTYLQTTHGYKKQTCRI